MFENPAEKNWMFGANVTDDGRYLLISVRKGSGNKVKVFYKDLIPSMKPTELVGNFDTNTTSSITSAPRPTSRPTATAPTAA
ncbi:MAG: hypothetical protein U0800_15445 [Isosphaeraceae bacterium]